MSRSRKTKILTAGTHWVSKGTLQCALTSESDLSACYAQAGAEIAFPCPKCKATIELDLRSKLAQDDTFSSHRKQRDYIKGETLKRRILRTVDSLPPMSQTVLKAREIMANPKSDFKELGELLETDQAIAIKALKLANSSYYGMSGKVTSIQHASVLLGHKILQG